MKITHVIDNLNPETGGPPKIALSLAAGQIANNHVSNMITQQHSKERINDVEKMIGAVPWGNAIRLIETQPHSLIDSFFNRVPDQVRHAIRQSDFVHLHSVWDPLVRTSANEARRQGKPYCILLNGMLDPWSLKQKWLKKRIAMRMGYRDMLENAAFLHLGNEEERKLIEPLKLKTEGRIFPNGVFLEEVDSFSPDGRFRKSYSQLEGRPFFLFLGRMHFKKGLDILAEAFAIFSKQNKDVDLVVAGPDGGEESTFKKRIKRHGLERRVHVIGPIYGKMKFAALHEALAFVLPSRQEGFSMAITEALAASRPVVITEGCHFNVVGEIGAGFVLNLDADAVAKALLKIAKNPTLSEQMGVKGRQFVEKHLTWPKIAEQVLEAYHDVLTASY